MFSAQLLAQFTWSGKSTKNVRKHAIKGYKFILGVVYETILAADSTYTMNQFEDDCVKKVMKFAFKGDEKRYSVSYI